MKDCNARMKGIAPYPFAEINKARNKAAADGLDVIDMGVGNPDLRPHASITEFYKQALDDAAHQNHRYPPFDGIPEFREAIAAWYKTRFHVDVDPIQEVLPLIGSKEGIAKFFLSYMDPGEIALVTSPCYPAYMGAVGISDGTLYEVPLKEENAYLPDLASIPEDIRQKASVILVNYPNNPTGAAETGSMYEEVLEFATKYDLLIISDIAYVELNLDPDYRSMSFLELPGAKERTIEFYSFSKTYSMPGWRLGFVAGRAPNVQTLLHIKTNMDFGVFMAMQRTGAFVLGEGDKLIAPTREVYMSRQNAVVEGLNRIGIKAPKSAGTIYVWSPIPEKYTSSMEFAKDVLTRTGVVFAPGRGFGTYGEGYMRISLIQTEERIREAIDRIEKAGLV